ncbi:MAG TPA: VWA domain-containing protein [Promineifilum sp.]|nr:VWA domain-containing protein [Promineifilum sp.]
MALLAPTALVLALLAVPILLLYMLRLRRREQPVSSTWLWRALVRDRAANAPWQRLRRNLLLFLQLLILAALVLALARLALRRPGLGGNLIVLLDASASMGASDGSPTRFDDARAAVDGLIGNLSGDDRLTLIRVGQTAEVLAAATTDRILLRRALAVAAPENGPADWPAAFALAAGSTQGLSNPRIAIISDGGLPEGLPPLPAEVTFLPVGRAGENLAITAQAARATASGPQLLVAVSNSGTTARSALLSLYLDNVLYDSRRVELAAGAQSAQTWSLPAGATLARTQLEPRDGLPDYLAVDNNAWTPLDAGSTRRVMLISDGNLFLERIFTVLPGYELFRMSSAEATQATAAEEPFDLTIYDGVPLPDGPLPSSALIFNPQPPSGAGADGSSPLVTVTGTFTETAAVRIADSPLLENVDWGSFAIANAQQVEAPTLPAVVSAAAGPLLLAGESNGRRVVVFTFDLRASDLPLQIAFPIIMANITAWLNPGRVIAADNSQPGSTVTLLPDGRAVRATVTLPDGSIWARDIANAAQPVVFDQTQQPGVYRLTTTDAAGAATPAGAFAVNFFDAGESHIQPAASLQVGQAQVTAATGGFEGLRELWPWLLAAALAVLLVEWWVAYRRPLFRTR